MSNRIAPSVRFVRSLEGTYYLLREAAEMLEVSPRTLRNFIDKDNDLLGPSFFTYLGKIKIYLYTEDDIKRLREYITEQKNLIYPISENPKTKETHKGRPAKWTAEQRKMRQRKFSQVHYYKNQAEKHQNAGNPAKAEKALKKMRQIQKQLREEDAKKLFPVEFKQMKEANAKRGANGGGSDHDLGQPTD